METSNELPGFSRYLVTIDGEVYRKETKKFMSKIKRGGYYFVTLTSDEGNRKQCGVHRLVALAFLENTENKPQVNHKDGNGYNNHVSNLEWATPKEQMEHARDNGLCTYKTKKVYCYDSDGTLVETFNSVLNAAKHFECDAKFISRAARGERKTFHGLVWSYKKLDERENEDENLDGEEWKSIDGFSNYQVSNFGRVLSTKGKIMSSLPRKDGYCKVRLTSDEGEKESFYIHRLVADSFLEKSKKIKKPVVNHKDGNKSNNSVCNLEWLELGENIQHAHDEGLFVGRKKIVQYDLKGNKLREFKNSKVAAQSIGNYARMATIANCCNLKSNASTAYGYIWRYFDDPIEAKRLDFKLNKRGVTQYSLDCKKIASFESIKDAAKKLGIDKSSISHSLSNNKLFAGGFQWRYSEDPPPTKILQPRGKKAVVQYTKQGEVVKKWECIRDAEKELGISGSHITSVCRGKRSTTGGYVWKYVCCEEPECPNVPICMECCSKMLCENHYILYLACSVCKNENYACLECFESGDGVFCECGESFCSQHKMRRKCFCGRVL